MLRGATVRFTASGLTEICWHLFTWGGLVRIVGPQNLVVNYVTHLKGALKAALQMWGENKIEYQK